MRSENRATQLIASTVMVLISLAIALGVGEVMLRMKNTSMENYDIEMWRYAKELKVPSANPLLGHEHVPGASALLQSVPLRINQQGLRGGPLMADRDQRRRILLLGSSITLGWGVAEENTLTQVLQTLFDQRGDRVEVLNGGIGNYNTVRYVERFLTRLTDLEPTDIVVQYFVNDAETLAPGGGSWLLRHSQLAVTLWIAFNRVFGATGEHSLLAHYQAVYAPESEGLSATNAALARLAAYAKAHGIRLYLAMTPDIHNLTPYPFGFIHDTVRAQAEAGGYRYVDLLPALADRDPQTLWAMPGDPHPNALGHQLMAEAVFQLLTPPTAP